MLTGPIKSPTLSVPQPRRRSVKSSAPSLTSILPVRHRLLQRLLALFVITVLRSDGGVARAIWLKEAGTTASCHRRVHCLYLFRFYARKIANSTVSDLQGAVCVFVILGGGSCEDGGEEEEEGEEERAERFEMHFELRGS